MIRIVHLASTVWGSNSLIHRSVLAVLGELEDGSRDRKALLSRRHARQPLYHPHLAGQFLPLPVVEHRLVIEQFNLEGAPA